MNRISLLVLLMLSAACGSRNDFDGDYVSSIDNSIAAGEFLQIRNIADIEARNDTVVFKTQTPGLFCPGAVVTVTTTGLNQGTMTIDMSSGINCIDGRQRSGRLIVNYNGKWSSTGSTLTISADNYTVAGWPVVLTEVVTFEGMNASNQNTYSIAITNGQVVTLQGTIHWSGNLDVSWTGGAGTPTIHYDNEYEVTGSGSGLTRYNYPFTWEILSPLVIQTSCGNVADGEIAVTPQDRSARTLRFGNGSRICDDRAVLTLGTYAEEITLP